MLRMRMLAVGIAAMIVPVFTATGLTLMADAAAHRKSAACKAPKGQKINISPSAWASGATSCMPRRWPRTSSTRLAATAP
jgi:hypothetical protein